MARGTRAGRAFRSRRARSRTALGIPDDLTLGAGSGGLERIVDYLAATGARARARQLRTRRRRKPRGRGADRCSPWPRTCASWRRAAKASGLPGERSRGPSRRCRSRRGKAVRQRGPTPSTSRSSMHATRGDHAEVCAAARRTPARDRAGRGPHPVLPIERDRARLDHGSVCSRAGRAPRCRASRRCGGRRLELRPALRRRAARLRTALRVRGGMQPRRAPSSVRRRRHAGRGHRRHRRPARRQVARCFGPSRRSRALHHVADARAVRTRAPCGNRRGRRSTPPSGGVRRGARPVVARPPSGASTRTRGSPRCATRAGERRTRARMVDRTRGRRPRV